ncbi:MAG: YafY family transcriptional regulator [Anaerolineae bacterium]|nr:YafY family transcriptional regulator [Anaerolineae bacterium]
MNRTDRLLGIVLELQAKGWLRAEDLAATFEVSKRTIYRDMDALAETGIPIMSQAGQGYGLVPGFFLPPVNFGVDEAVVLLLGADYIAKHFDSSYAQAAHHASSKIEAVLPERLRAEAQAQRGIMYFVNWTGDLAQTDMLRKLRQALLLRRQIEFGYYARYGEGRGETRVVDPYALVNVFNHWYLTGYDHARQDWRNFRLERMEQVAVLPRTFVRDLQFKLGPRPSDDRDLIVKVLFSHEVARWVQEEHNFFTLEEEFRDDGLLVTFAVRREDDLFTWLLSWGAQARVLEPEGLIERLRTAASEILALYQ